MAMMKVIQFDVKTIRSLTVSSVCRFGRNDMTSANMVVLFV